MKWIIVWFTIIVVLINAQLSIAAIPRIRIGSHSTAAITAKEWKYHAKSIKIIQPNLDTTRQALLIRSGVILSDGSVSQALNLRNSKIFVQIGLTVFNILCWALPLRSKRFTQNHTMLSMANSFAGGIFLMLSFGHLLPEAVSTMSSVTGKDGGTVLAYALLGYTAMLFIEKVAFATHKNTDDSIDEMASPPPAEVASGLEAHRGRMQAAIALCCAMSIHSFFEAAALGLATDHASMMMMAVCIALHQPAESVALLVAFLKSGMPHRSVALWLTAFSAVSLGGVAAGLTINQMASGQLGAIAMAITAGTFLYVGATEV